MPEEEAHAAGTVTVVAVELDVAALVDRSKGRFPWAKATPLWLRCPADESSQHATGGYAGNKPKGKRKGKR